MCGIEVFKRADRVLLRSKAKLVVWDHEKGIMVGVRKYGAVEASKERHLRELEAGDYRFDAICNGVVYYNDATAEELEEYRQPLEMEGFPLSGSLRVIGFNK